MTKPQPLHLIPLDIPVEVGMLYGNDCLWRETAYRFGLGEGGTLWLIYRHHANGPRVSVHDPHWNANHGLRYVEWVTP